MWVFFFSSRRRHTRLQGDWSSDVCSSDLYVLKVRGQSMIDEHIKDGDFIVVHERNQADNGQTVVALVHGSSATVKRFYREPGGWIRLEPANPTMTALRVNERDVVVQGVVVGVIRKY